MKSLTQIEVDRAFAPTSDEEHRRRAASMYAARVAGMNDRKIASRFEVPVKSVARTLDGIPGVVRAAIERSVRLPGSEAVLWQAEVERDARLVETMTRIVVESIEESGLVGRKRIPKVSDSRLRIRSLYQARVGGESLDSIASREGTTKGRIVASIARLTGRERRLIEREARSSTGGVGT